MGRKLWHIMLNDIRLYFSYRSALLFFFLLPILFMWVLGATFGGGQENESITLPILLVDEDQTQLSTFVAMRLRHEPSIVLLEETDLARAMQRFEEDEALMLVVLPRGFETNVLAGQPVEIGYRLASDSTRAIAAQQAVENAVAAAGSVATTLNAMHTFLRERGITPPDIHTLLPPLLASQATPALTLSETRITPQETGLLSGTEQAVLGQIITWGLITFLGASTVFLTERQRGTLARLLASPTPPWLVLMGKLLSRYTLGVVQSLLLLGAGTVLLGVHWGEPIAMALVVLAFALTGVTLGIAIATFVRSASAAAALSTLLAMLLSALGGAWWPLEITPPAYQTVARLLPTTWAMQAFQKVVAHGAGTRGVLPDIAILAGFAALFLLAGMRTFRNPI